MKRRALTMTLLAMSLATSVGASTIRVPSDEPTIQAGVDAASPGDTVLVAPGTYAGAGNRNISFGGKDLVLRSESGQVATTIDCEFMGRGFTFVASGESSAAVVEGFTVRNGVEEYGGGMVLWNSSPTIADCTFTGNRAGTGGGVSCSSNPPATFKNCTFSANSTHVLGGAFGGAAACSGSSGTLFLHCTFSANEASGGGAIYCSGGGTSARFEDCVFRGNSASVGGGAAYCSFGSPTFTRCIFDGNSATISGGAVYARSSRPAFASCTLFGNNAMEAGGGADLGSSIVTFRNTIIAFSTNGEAIVCSNQGVELSCCDLYGNAGGDWVGCIANQLGTNGNISADPLFCESGNSDFTLHAYSPCAPENSPDECGLIGAEPVACGVAFVTTGGSPPGKFGIRVLPQPFTNQGVLEWTNELSGTVVLKLYDPRGRLVLSRDLGNRRSGLQHLRWGDVRGSTTLAAGVYFVELTGPSSQRESTQIVVAR